jgi:hypothetical protein
LLLFEAGMEAEDLLEFIASGKFDLMTWASFNCPDYYKIVEAQK